MKLIKDTSFKLRIEPELLEKARDHAKASGLSVSALFRACLQRELASQKPMVTADDVQASLGEVIHRLQTIYLWFAEWADVIDVMLESSHEEKGGEASA